MRDGAGLDVPLDPTGAFMVAADPEARLDIFNDPLRHRNILKEGKHINIEAS